VRTPTFSRAKDRDWSTHATLHRGPDTAEGTPYGVPPPPFLTHHHPLRFPPTPTSHQFCPFAPIQPRQSEWIPRIHQWCRGWTTPPSPRPRQTATDCGFTTATGDRGSRDSIANATPSRPTRQSVASPRLLHVDAWQRGGEGCIPFGLHSHTGHPMEAAPAAKGSTRHMVLLILPISPVQSRVILTNKEKQALTASSPIVGLARIDLAQSLAMHVTSSSRQ
jgi:hypothetical protein